MEAILRDPHISARLEQSSKDHVNMTWIDDPIEFINIYRKHMGLEPMGRLPCRPYVLEVEVKDDANSDEEPIKSESILVSNRQVLIIPNDVFKKVAVDMFLLDRPMGTELITLHNMMVDPSPITFEIFKSDMFIEDDGGDLLGSAPEGVTT